MSPRLVTIAAVYFDILCRKMERKLTVHQFEKAVKMVADKKYPGDPKGLEKIQSKLTGPTTHPEATVCTTNVFHNQWDAAIYPCRKWQEMVFLIE